MKNYFDKLSKKITDYFLSHTKVDPKAFKRKSKVDWYMDEDEALSNGVIDEIVENFDVLY